MALSRETGIEYISNSEMATFKRCERKWWFAYYRELGLKAESVVGPLALGTRIHHALAAYYSPNPENPVVVFEKTVLEDQEKFPELIDDIEKQADLGRAMLEGYAEWLEETGADANLRIIAPETRLEIQSGFPNVRLVGKLDVRVERETDNVVLFMDHKTVANLTEPVRTLHMDEQMLQYHLLEYMDYLAMKQAAIERGEPEPSPRFTDGGLYNMLRKVKRTARANPPFFERVEVRHNMHELRAYWQRVHGTVGQILERRKALDAGGDHHYVVPPTPNRNCTWDCDFFLVCPLHDDGSNVEGLIEEYYERRDPMARYETEVSSES